MKAIEWNDALNHLDTDIVEQYIEQKDSLRQRNKIKNFRMRIGALAACFLLMVSAVITLPMLKSAAPPITDDPPPLTPAITLPTIPTIAGGNVISGKQEAMHGDLSYTSVGTSLYCYGPNAFYVNTVIHARITEILPDKYYVPVSPTTNYYYRIVKLSVIESIRGEGLPDEILLGVFTHVAEILEGYEEFILSLEQTGIENYMMINQTTNEVTYFPHMFDIYSERSSVIAFNNGTVDASFWEKIEENKAHREDLLNMFNEGKINNYPAEPGFTISEVKEKLLYLMQNKLTLPDDRTIILNMNPDYITAENVFFTDESKLIKEYLEPSENNVFTQEIYHSSIYSRVYYQRIINGFVTEEEIIVDIDSGTVKITEEAYSDSDLERLPDIGKLLAEIDLTQFQPPHTKLNENLIYRCTVANGTYRKGADGKVYGIVRIVWYYSRGRQRLRDDCYFVYDSTGNGSVLERDELKKLIGNDGFILDFEYNRPTNAPRLIV